MTMYDFQKRMKEIAIGIDTWDKGTAARLAIEALTLLTQNVVKLGEENLRLKDEIGEVRRQVRLLRGRVT